MLSWEFKGPDPEKILKELEEAIEKGLDDFADEVLSTWKEKASQTLKTSRDKYVAGLSSERTKGGVKITLAAGFPAMIEVGTPRWDLKNQFLQTVNRRAIPMGNPVDRFRTVHVQTAADKFWHPGLQARKIHEQVAAELPKINDKIFSPLISKIKV